MSNPDICICQADHAPVPRATVGPDEPHAASRTYPETIIDKDVSWDPEVEMIDLEGFLDSPLPSHPKLHRGQLKNGLRYLILPNKVPANRYDKLLFFMRLSLYLYFAISSLLGR